jgi:hypothetical protein
VIAGIYNITCDQGSTFERVFRVTYQDEVDPDLYHPYDFSGYTARMQIRRDVSATTTLAVLTTQNGSITIGGEEGTVTISLTATQTAAIERSGVYDIEIIAPDQSVQKIVRGNFELNLEVTR